MASFTPLGSLVLLVVVVMASPAEASGEGAGGLYVRMCAPAPRKQTPTNGSAFRANVDSLLGRLPSATVVSGFASLRSGGDVDDRDCAFARGLCFGVFSPARCLSCLSFAANNLTGSCGARRRAGIWTDGCFVGLADTNASSADEEAFRERVFFGGDTVEHADASLVQALDTLARSLSRRAANSNSSLWMLATVQDAALTGNFSAGGTKNTSTVSALAQCTPDRTAAECARCLRGATRALTRCCEVLDYVHGGVATVVGSTASCEWR